MTYKDCWLAAALAVVGCAQEGALEQAQLLPECAPDDVVCATLGLSSPIAVGSELKVEVTSTSPGVGNPNIRLESVRSDVAAIEESAIVGVGVGMTAILMTTDQGDVLDFMHLWVAQPSRIGFYRYDGDIASTEELEQDVQLLVGDEIALAVAAYRGGERLIGAASVSWFTDGDVVTLLNEGVVGRRRVVARSAGVAVVRVESLDNERELRVEVLP